ncbi:MAG: hypothetical protein R3195_05075 [Gemmatimonadota bacterium]|nr:hypothetical protein [Gemmatimonadota bacterium]
MVNRPRRSVSAEGDEWTLVDAWRSGTGLGLGYFLAASAVDDRRVVLEPGRTLESLEEGEIGRLLEGSAPLTTTERRFGDSGGRAWLAQSFGPVWGEGVASGLTGLRIVCLTAEEPAVEVMDARLEDLSDDDLAALVEAAAVRGESGED